MRRLKYPLRLGASGMKHGLLVDLGRMPYRPAWELQRRVGQAVAAETLPDTVLLVEHTPVYTLGRAAHGQFTNLVWDDATLLQEGIELVEVDRGGDITYHGPGQLVGYPIVHLGAYDNDLHRYLRLLEEGLIMALDLAGIKACRVPPHTGVWVGEEKIAAIGVKASGGVTQHGFALNIDPNLEHFRGIIPCGIRDKGVTSMQALLPQKQTLEAMKPSVIQCLGEVLDLALTAQPLGYLEEILGHSQAAL